MLQSIRRRPASSAAPSSGRSRTTTATRARPSPRLQVQSATVALTRFSTLAAVLVAALALAGGLLAWRILGSWDALVATGYGQALLVKTFLVAVAVALAGYNRYRALPAVTAAPDADTAWPRLRRTVAAEAAVLVAVLAVTGWLVNASPTLDNARVSQTPPPVAIEQTAALGADTVTARITPGTVGINSLEFTVTDQEGRAIQPVSDPQVSVTMPAAGVGPLIRPVTGTGPGAYQSALDLPAVRPMGRDHLRPHRRVRATVHQHPGEPAMTEPRPTRMILRRGLTLIALALTALIGPAPVAGAHVDVDSVSPNGDGTSTVTLVWDHGCTPNTTTIGVDVAAGDGVTFTAAATDVAGWTFTVDPEKVSFTGPGIPTGQEATIEVVARITGTPGRTITFPSIQHCGDQQTGWNDPDPSAEHPAPSLIATAAILTPAAPAAEPTSGADISQVLTGIVLLAAALGAAGFLTHHRTHRDR